MVFHLPIVLHSYKIIRDLSVLLTHWGGFVNSTLYERINQYFINRDYQQIPTDSDTVKMYGIYDKSNLYLINVIELKDGYGLDPERYLEYKQITMHQFLDENADKTILLNIILTEDTDKLYDDFNYVPDITEQFIDVLWFVNTKEEQMVIPKRQLRSVLGIEKDLRKLMQGEELSHYKVNRLEQIPLITSVLLLINVAIWLYTESIGSSTDPQTLLRLGAIYAPLILNEGEYLRLLQSMFLHIGMIHLFHNMIGLYIFGYRLERYLSRWQFVVVYIGSGLVGSVVSVGLDVFLGRAVIAAGASGAVYGLMGAMVVVTRMIKRPIDGVSTYIVWIMFTLGIVHSITTPGISLSAHLGGFVGGLLLTTIVLNSSKRIDI